MLRFFNENTRSKSAVLCILSGVLMGLSYPPFKSWYLMYFGLLILFYLVLNSIRLKQAFARSYLTLIVMNAITLYWISGWHSNDTFLKLGGIATVFVHSFFMLFPLLLVYGVKKISNKTIALIFLPLIWVGFEYFDNQWQFSFPWLELGNTETYNLNRIQYAEFTGVHGISFLIMIVTVCIYFSAERIFSGKWKLIGFKTAALTFIWLLILLLPNYYSSQRLNAARNEIYFKTDKPEKIINTCITQANTDPYRKWGGNLDSLIISYINILTRGLNHNPDLILLHETAPPYYFFEDYNRVNTDKFLRIVDQYNKYLLMGIPHLEYYNDPELAPNDSRVTKTGKKYDSFNAAVLLEPGKRKEDYKIHKKVKLVPFSERVPYQELFPFAEKVINWGVGISHWQRGKELVLFDMENQGMKPRARFETLICYESVYSELASTGVKNGAEFVAIVTNDGWWGNTAGPVQHEQYAVLRAIETRKWVVRCAQTGVSCFIDPLGNISDEIAYNTEGLAIKNIIANSEKTFFVQNGDLIGRISFYIFALTAAVLVINYVIIKILKRKA